MIAQRGLKTRVQKLRFAGGPPDRPGSRSREPVRESARPKPRTGPPWTVAPEEGPFAWLARAERDLAVGRELAALSRWEYAAVQAQQAAEKALKACALTRGDQLLRTHDLETLARACDAPASILDAAAFLSPFYLAGRYPDVEQPVSGDDAFEALRKTEEVVAWCRKQMS